MQPRRSVHIRLIPLAFFALASGIDRPLAAQADIVISEIMTTSFEHRDDDGDIVDWVEFFNAGNVSVNLDGWYVTDEIALKKKWRFPAVTINPGQFLLVYASDKNRRNPAAALHLNFKLTRLGEFLALIEPDGETVHFEFFPYYPPQAEDHSYGLAQNASSATLVGPASTARAFVPTNGSLGSNWKLPGFNDGAWRSGSNGVGYDTGSEYNDEIEIDIESEMQGQYTSAYIRLPFNIADADSVSGLVLKVKYDDGFAAFLNGEEVTSRNGVANPSWDSAATGQHDDAAAQVYEEIDISSHASALQNGANVLAIHGLNVSTGSSDFLIVAELDAVFAGDLERDHFQFFPTPTPGSVNGPGFDSVANKPQFSEPSGVFSGSFLLTLSIPDGQQIRYTTNGSIPDSGSAVYTGPITVGDSITINARGFATGAAPSTNVSRTYMEIASNLVNQTSNLPLMLIDTFNRGIGADNWTPSFAAIVDVEEDGRARLGGDFSFAGSSGIKTHGSSSQGFPKKNYRIELWDEKQQDEAHSLLDMPKESDWVLHGPYSDKSLMRNYLSYEWSNRMGQYASRCRFVELYLNTGSGNIQTNDYQGVYVIVEKIKRDRARVNVAKLLGSDVAEPEISGGYIIKKDRPDPGDNGFRTSRGQDLRYVYPKEEDISSAQSSYIRNYINQFEAALYGANFRDPNTGYARYIDVDSFIDHHIMVELTKNIDGYRLSTFFHKKREGKLFAGPIWDYNLSLRNADYLQGWIPQGWYYPQLNSNDYPWWPRLQQDPSFMQRYVDRWTELRADVFDNVTLFQSVNAATAQINEASSRNFSKWSTLGSYVWPNPNPLARTFAEEISLMRSWLASRVSWIDSTFNNDYATAPRFNRDGGNVDPGFMLEITAPTGTIYYTLDGTDPRLPNGTISPDAEQYAGDVEITENTQVIARAYRSTTRWSGPTKATFVTATPPLAITEIMYHPTPGAGGIYRDEDFEFIELQNVGAGTLDLDGFRLTNGVLFDFPSMSLAPGEFVVVVSNDAAFITRYGVAGIRIAGVYEGLLENAGERIELLGPLDEQIFDFEYDDLWYPETDGDGYSLTILDAGLPFESWADEMSWGPSAELDGTPGSGGSGTLFGWQRAGDANQDGRLDLSDSVSVLRRLFFDPTGNLPCDGASMDEGGNAFVFDINGDAKADVSDAIFALNYLFSNGPAPAGVECQRIEGCRSACQP